MMLSWVTIFILLPLMKMIHISITQLIFEQLRIKNGYEYHNFSNVFNANSSENLPKGNDKEVLWTSVLKYFILCYLHGRRYLDISKVALFVKMKYLKINQAEQHDFSCLAICFVLGFSYISSLVFIRIMVFY